MFVPVANATDGGHRDCPVLASVAQWPEIQPLVSRGQIVSGVLPLLTDRQTDNYNFSIMNSRGSCTSSWFGELHLELLTIFTELQYTRAYTWVMYRYIYT